MRFDHGTVPVELTVVLFINSAMERARTGRPCGRIEVPEQQQG